ncbi:PKD domain-containing protein [Lewinella sp. IMCC34191]|uniref:PKD domain-containing protein n=1 Tax=Lewinella sp. IMCC34191 TaxID=2259172 RepID=UPI000E236B3C|nr:PKD domain-containing protein [Lewinella sp. IMCC34191]
MTRHITPTTPRAYPAYLGTILVNLAWVALLFPAPGTAQDFIQTAKLYAVDGGSGDRFGSNVDISGDLAIVGASRANRTSTNLFSGQAYLFQRTSADSDQWQQIAELNVEDGDRGPKSGSGVAIDGDVAAVSWVRYDANRQPFSGIYVFSRDAGGPGQWGQVATLFSPNLHGDDVFGQSLDVSGDLIIVGAPGDSINDLRAGSAYLFSRDAGGPDNWGQIAKFTTPDPADYDGFGVSVAISGDKAIVGALNNSDEGLQAGFACIFHRNADGFDQWGLVTKLTAPDPVYPNYFGRSVAISGDLVIVADDLDDESGTDAGAAYVFARNQGGTDLWGQVAKLIPESRVNQGGFGYDVSISDSVAIVAAPFDNALGPYTGLAYVYHRNAGGPDRWSSVGKLMAADASAEQYFGRSLALSNDQVIIGAANDDENGENSGAAYIFAGQGDCSLTLSTPATVSETCPGASDGSISVQATGTSGPKLSYLLTGPVAKTNTTGIFTGLPPGDYVVRATETGGSNCVATSAQVTLATGSDDTPPSARARDITVELDATGTATITAADLDDGSSDACGIARIDIDRNAFGCGDLGANPVVLTVTDLSGKTASATAMVTVVANPDRQDINGDGVLDACEWYVEPRSTFWLEAECATVGRRWMEAIDPEASSERFVYVADAHSMTTPPSDAAPNRVTFTLPNAEAGTYRLFARVLAPGPDSDSYWLRVNDGEWVKWSRGFERGPNFRWNRLPVSLSLREGRNLIDFAYRESGTGLDKIYLTKQPTIPVGVGEFAQNCAQAPPNLPPVAAVAPAPTFGVAPFTLSLDATPSYDPEGRPLTYRWAFGSQNRSGAILTETFAAGTYELTLIVTDPAGRSDTATVFLQVTEPTADTDNDGVLDGTDNCPGQYNPDQLDTDGNGVGDGCEEDPFAKTSFWLEAECAGVGENWVAAGRPDASGDYVYAPGATSLTSPPTDVSANLLRFTVTDAAPGSYYVFARILAAGPESDSFWVRTNGGEWYAYNRNIRRGSSFYWNRMPARITLAAGTNVIDVAYREGNTRLDKIHLNRESTTPLGLGGTDRSCLPDTKALPVVLHSGSASGAQQSPRELRVFPNPVDQTLTVQVSSTYTGLMDVSIYDANGRVIHTQGLLKQDEFITHRLDLATLPAGIYRLSVIEGPDRTVRTFVKL